MKAIKSFSDLCDELHIDYVKSSFFQSYRFSTKCRIYDIDFINETKL